MNFFIVSPNASNNKSEQPIWERVIIKEKVVLMGWGDDNKYGKMFLQDLHEGDFVLIAQGSNKGKKLFLGGVVSSGVGNKQFDGAPRPIFYRKITNLVAPEILDALNLDFKGSAMGATSRIPAIYKLYPNSNLKDKIIVEKLKKSLSLIKTEEMKELIKSILKYKKQIILQGPPGTGKTYLAKKIAKALTMSIDKGSPMQKINDFFKNFNPNDPKVKANRIELESKLKAFTEKFPKEELHKMGLEDYCIGTGMNNSFCWWIERGLQRLGYYFPGSSRSYLIYHSKTYDQYSTHFKHSPSLSAAESIEEAMSILAGIISKLVNDQDTSDAEKNLGISLIIKILNSYYPEKYFPVNGKVALNNLLRLFGINKKGLSPIEMNLEIQEFFEKKRKEFNSDVRNFEFMQFLFDEYDLKGEIEIQSNTVVAKGESKLIQFHPAYTYEDFVRGIVVETHEGSPPEYKVVDKMLAEFARKALENKSSNYVLIIDEINRANLPSVLGELIYALEYRFDPEKPEETSVESMYSLRDDDDSESSEGRILRLPQNLLIIGTMNTADRSVGHIDYAIRRRFAFVDVLPRLEPVHDDAKVNFELVSSLFVKNPKEVLTANSNPERSDFLSPDFRPEDVWIGHSYFLTDKTEEEAKQELGIKMKYEVVPLLKEYLKDGILIDEAKVKAVIHTISH